MNGEKILKIQYGYWLVSSIAVTDGAKACSDEM